MIKTQKTKTILCKPNGRSADFTSANFILGCQNFVCSYCYVNRFDRKFIYVNTNTDQILAECDKAIENSPFPKIPNQVDDKYYFVDISCDTDINRHWYDYNWFYVFDYFKNHPKLAATFATKWVNTNLLDYEPLGKIRIRMSLMPNIELFEKGTSPIINRIKFLEKLFKAGYSTHINLSPIIYKEGWLKDYSELFKMINDNVSERFKQQCGLECIFLTHNENLHNKNVAKGLEAETYLWNPDLQVEKTSQYGGNNVRYKDKYLLVQQFEELVNKELQIKIRYIF